MGLWEAQSVQTCTLQELTQGALKLGFLWSLQRRQSPRNHTGPREAEYGPAKLHWWVMGGPGPVMRAGVRGEWRPEQEERAFCSCVSRLCVPPSPSSSVCLPLPLPVQDLMSFITCPVLALNGDMCVTISALGLLLHPGWREWSEQAAQCPHGSDSPSLLKQVGSEGCGELPRALPPGWR